MIKINIIRGIITSIVWVYCKFVYRVKVNGSENIPKTGAVLFCGNHRSFLDPVLLICFSKRKIRFIGKEELEKNWFLKIVLRLFNVITVNRDSNDFHAVKESIKTLKKGECIGIFPEGTRNGFEKNGGQIHNGASYLAMKTGSTIIPVGIAGKLKPFHKVTLNYGKPIDYSKYLNEKITKQLEEKATEELKQSIIYLTNNND